MPMQTRLRTAGLWMVNGFVLLESLRDVDVWGVPGGTLEEGESAADGCVREYQEPPLKFGWFSLDGLAEVTLVPGWPGEVLPRLGDGTVFLSTREEEPAPFRA